MDFVPEDQVNQAELLLANLWALCDERLDLDGDDAPTIEMMNIHIADAINTLHKAYMIINIGRLEQPQGFFSYSNQEKNKK